MGRPVAGSPPRGVSVRNCGDQIAADPPGGWGGWGLGKPDRTVWPPARLSVAGTPVPTYDDGFPKAHPSLPPGKRAVRVRTETLPAGGSGLQRGSSAV